MSSYNSVVRRAVLIVSVWTIQFGLAHADSARDLVEQISSCTAIADAAARLQCFDRAAAGAKEALAPKAADFGKPPTHLPEVEVEQITATVRELSKTVRGRALFVLDNGQVWRQLDADDAQVAEPATGGAMKVTIARGFLGNYNLTIEGHKGLVRVRRIE